MGTLVNLNVQSWQYFKLNLNYGMWLLYYLVSVSIANPDVCGSGQCKPSSISHAQINPRNDLFIGSLTFWQHQRSCEDRYWLVTVRTHVSFTITVLSNDPISHSVTIFWHRANEFLPYLAMLCARLGSKKYQFCKSLVWCDWESNAWPSRWQACALLMQPSRLA